MKIGTRGFLRSPVWKKSIGKYWIQYSSILFFSYGLYESTLKIRKFNMADLNVKIIWLEWKWILRGFRGPWLRIDTQNSTIQYGGPECKKSLNWNENHYLGVFKVADCESLTWNFEIQNGGPKYKNLLHWDEHYNSGAFEVPVWKKSIGKYWIQYFIRSKVLEIREKSTGSNTYQYFFFIRVQYIDRSICKKLLDLEENRYLWIFGVAECGLNNSTLRRSVFAQFTVTNIYLSVFYHQLPINIC